MRLKPCLSAIEFTTRRNHGRLSDSVPSRSNIASLYLGMIRIALSFCPSANLSVGPRSHALGVGAHMIKRHDSPVRLGHRRGFSIPLAGTSHPLPRS